MSSSPDIRRLAGWLPDQEGLEAWLADLRERAAAHADRPLHPAVAALRDLLDREPVLRMHAEQMIEQEPRGREYSSQHLDDVPQLLRLVDEVIRVAPGFDEGGPVSTPLGAVLDQTMATPAGFAFYRDPRVNAALEEVLGAWCAFLDSPDSLGTMVDAPSGWMSDAAREAVGIEQFEYDPSAEHWGFTSWNDFFTRRFRDGVRPVEAPDDDLVVVSACEATSYGLASDVSARDRFWVKSQSYSLHDMLAGDPVVADLEGGTVYQAFLSADNYHRWHSPVAGTVVRAFRVPGTYYSEADAEGADAGEPQNSQGYLAHVATRAVIVIEADSPSIGRLAVVQVGMSDVSSVVLHPDLTPGHHLAKGDELGHFRFGGSTWCLVLGPGVVRDVTLAAVPLPHDPAAAPVAVRSALFRAHADRRPGH